MRPLMILQLLVLLALANGAPVLARRIFGDRLSFPLDGGAWLPDRQRLFGPAKTLRGITIAGVATAIGGSLTGLGWKIGLLVAVTAMAGDVFSSFLKRRFKLAPSSQSLGLDQVPESLFPLLACQGALSLSVLEVAVTLVCFFIGQLAISRVLYRLHIRERPY